MKSWNLTQGEAKSSAWTSRCYSFVWWLEKDSSNSSINKTAASLSSKKAPATRRINQRQKSQEPQEDPNLVPAKTMWKANQRQKNQEPPEDPNLAPAKTTQKANQRQKNQEPPAAETTYPELPIYDVSSDDETVDQDQQNSVAAGSSNSSPNNNTSTAPLPTISSMILNPSRGIQFSQEDSHVQELFQKKLEEIHREIADVAIIAKATDTISTYVKWIWDCILVSSP